MQSGNNVIEKKALEILALRALLVQSAQNALKQRICLAQMGLEACFEKTSPAVAAVALVTAISFPLEMTKQLQ